MWVLACRWTQKNTRTLNGAKLSQLTSEKGSSHQESLTMAESALERNSVPTPHKR
jgi:hypothetical protein